MSSNKYADLPDIDTAPDVYETEDALPSAQDTVSTFSQQSNIYSSAPLQKGEESDEDLPQRGNNNRSDPNEKEEIDSRNLVPTEASRRFLKAEHKQRQRTYFAYPPSPTEEYPLADSQNTRPLSLSARLRSLQIELTALEAELSDPSNPQLVKERETDNVDPGKLIRGLVDVRGRLDKLRKEKEGRAKLVGVVLSDANEEKTSREDQGGTKGIIDAKPVQSEARTMSEMDRRVGDLEKIIGSSSASLDETSPLPPPLLPLMTRLQAQLTLLAQPRHIDSISRRLKLLLSDLDRVSVAQQQAARRQQNQSSDITATLPPQIQDTILPILTRLGPALPQIPHLLTRLRTLAMLHVSAAEFSETIDGLGEDQRKIRDALRELDGAVSRVENSLEENRSVVKGNVAGLEARLESLLNRLEDLSRR
ncbi:hypothetical protein H0H93_010214 [Arthromyces matolae]|nr:hypothetical protein H0H93_010214 [Arthromyces matolae]